MFKLNFAYNEKKKKFFLQIFKTQIWNKNPSHSVSQLPETNRLTCHTVPESWIVQVI